ncbi:polyprenyl synthetase family protein [Gordonia alkaliphila]|uniref:polyprenyl synthetase family protein n=1 Tax=Gordonia alkaliphila TaxID=1053547 RepID=UPI0027E284ED|nr:polyprenyl synthetase family protein [Gordonia alkaliphila]
MLSQQQVPGAVENILRDFVAATAPSLDEISPVVAEAGAALAEFVLTGGKRLRPLFVHAGWQCAATGPEAAATEALALRVGGAIELIQACALVHDDILDRSDTRRGRPTVHRRFSALHRDQRWSGDSAHHGASVAILLGDLALAWADDLVHGLAPPPEHRGRDRPTPCRPRRAPSGPGCAPRSSADSSWTSPTKRRPTKRSTPPTG